MSKMTNYYKAVLVFILSTHHVIAFQTNSLAMKSKVENRSLHIMHEKRKNNDIQSSIRRKFLYETISLTGFLVGTSSPANAVERAVGGAEKSCREEGNCLEKFEIDGAVGWSWGGKDRCDP